MIRRPLVYSTVLAILLASCSGGGEETEAPRPTRATTTSSTLPPTTTTTKAPKATVRVEGAPRDLETLVEDFYSYALGAVAEEPSAPVAVLEQIEPSQASLPSTGSATTATFREEDVAVVEVGSDLFLAVDDGSGWRVVGGEWPTLSVPAYFGETPRMVAVVGSDARPGQDVDRSRADSIHFVALDGSGGGAIVGLPRDSYVPIPGFGSGKITTSLSRGGPDAMMAAFQELTELPLEGYVLTGFSGFESLLGTVLGGVDIDVPFSINDRWAHVTLSAGEQVLDGAEALGFARARKTVPGGDFTRSEHQGMIMLAAAEVVDVMGLGAIPELLEASAPHLETDLSAEQLLTFSAMAASADLDEIPNVVAPGSPGWAGSASVVYLSSSVDELWADLEDGRLEN
jgi:LCP family protein required for cell wall assembly